MKRKWAAPSTALCLTAIGLALIAGCSGCATVEKSQTPSQDSSTAPVATKAPEPSATAAQPPLSVSMPSPAPFFPTPDKMDLCGDPVPLHIQDVQERFDKEFTIIVYNHGQVYLWLKRMERYFPWIEDRLRSYKLPDDLKYVVIAESDLMPNVSSSKGAAGPWQFMPSTGSSYGLQQQGSYDSRFDFERSTESAFRLLDDLHRRYNSWTMAIAAYNCGDKRILDEAQAQKVNNYYLLKLPQETERYVFRILAIKAVLSNPSKYGYNLPKGQGYPEHRLDRVVVSLSSPVPIQAIADASGTTFREFKRLNPTFRADHIPAGTYQLKLPEGTGLTFEQNFKAGKTQTPSDSTSLAEGPTATRPEQKPQAAKPQPKAPVEKFHVVKKGETLSSIAKHYKVSVQDIRQANKIKTNTVSAGQKIKIPSP